MATASLTDITPETPANVASLSDIQGTDHDTIAQDATNYLRQYDEGDKTITPDDAGMLHRVAQVAGEYKHATQAELDAANQTPTWLRAARSVIEGGKQAGAAAVNWLKNPTAPPIPSAETLAKVAAAPIAGPYAPLLFPKQTAELVQGGGLAVAKAPAVVANLAVGVHELSPVTAMMETLPTPLRDLTQKQLAQERASADMLQHYTNTGANDISRITGISHDTAAAMIGENLAYAAVPMGELNTAEAMANAVRNSTNMVGNIAGGAKWAAAKAAPYAVGAGKFATVDTGLHWLGAKLGIPPNGVNELLAFLSAKGGNAELANKAAQAAFGQDLPQIIEDAAVQATKPLGQTSNEAWAGALRQKSRTLQEAIDGLTKDLDTSDAKKVTELASDGSLKYATEDLPKEAQGIRAKRQQVDDLNEKATAILKRNDLQKVFDSATQAFGNLGLHTASGAAVGASFSGSQAPTGDTDEAVGVGATIGGLLGLATSPFATRSGMRSVRMRKGFEALKERAVNADNIVGDISGLSPTQQNHIYSIAGMSDAIGGKKVFLETPDSLRQSGALEPDADPGQGFTDAQGNLHLNIESIPDGVANHEFTHATQRFFGESLAKASPELMTDFETKYQEALRATGRQSFNSRSERDAEVGKLVLDHAPIETFYGGEQGGDVVSRIFNGMLGEGKTRFIHGFDAPFDRSDVASMKGRFFRAGELAQMQEGRLTSKPPDVPFSQYTSDQAAKFHRAFEFNKQQGMEDPEAFKDVADNIDFLPRRKPGQTRQDQLDEQWEKYFALSQQQSSDISAGGKVARRLRPPPPTRFEADHPFVVMDGPDEISRFSSEQWARSSMEGYAASNLGTEVKIKIDKRKYQEPSTGTASVEPPRTAPKVLKPYERTYGWLDPEGKYIDNEGSDIHAETITKLLFKEGKVSHPDYYTMTRAWKDAHAATHPDARYMDSMGVAYNQGWKNGYIRLKVTGSGAARKLWAHLPKKYELSSKQLDDLIKLSEDRGITKIIRDLQPGEKTLWTSEFFDKDKDNYDWLPKPKKGQTREQQVNDLWERYYAEVQHQNSRIPAETEPVKEKKPKWYDPTTFSEDARSRSLLPPKQRPELEKYEPKLGSPKEVYGWLDPKGQYIENEHGDLHATAIARLLQSDKTPDLEYPDYHELYGSMTGAYAAGFKAKHLRLTNLGRTVFVHYPESFGDIPKRQIDGLIDLAKKHNMTAVLRDTDTMDEPVIWRANDKIDPYAPWEETFDLNKFRNNSDNIDYSPKAEDKDSPYFVEKHGGLYAIVDRRKPSDVGFISSDLEKVKQRKSELDEVRRPKTGASGMWDSTFVEGEGEKQRLEIASELGVDPKKHYYEQKPEAKKKIHDYFMERGADYSPKPEREVPDRFYAQPQMGHHDAIIDRLTGKVVNRYEGPDPGEYSSDLPYGSAQQMADANNVELPPLPPGWTGPHPDAHIPEIVRQHPDGTWGIDGPNNTIQGKFPTSDQANKALEEAHRQIYNPDEPARLDYQPKKDLNDKYPAPVNSAAILDSNTGKIYPGQDHMGAYAVWYKFNKGGDNSGLRDGFVDDRGQFLTRTEAGARMKETGQLPIDVGMDTNSQLFNEFRSFRPKPITKDEARGNSRPVSLEEFNKLADSGRQQLDAIRANKRPSVEGMQKNWNDMLNQAYAATRKEWGGVTINPETGRDINLGSGRESGGPYAMSVKDEGQQTISVPIDAPQKEFNAAMAKAVKAFPQLDSQDHYLGVFRDDDVGRIDIDPVLIVDKPEQVDAIGAYTHAIGGAYDYATGNGHFPPHVVEPQLNFRPNPHPDAIKQAAIKHDDGRIFTGDYHSAIEAANSEKLLGSINPIDGYVTNSGEFLGREQAFLRGKQFNQIPQDFAHEEQHRAIDEGRQPELLGEDIRPEFYRPSTIEKAKELAGKADNITNSEDEFFGKIWPKLLRQTGELEPNTKPGIIRAAEKAVDEIQDFYKNNPAYSSYYDTDLGLAKDIMSKHLGELTPQEFKVFQASNGLLSTQTELRQNTNEAINATRLFKNTGALDGFDTEIGAKGSPVTKSRPFEVGGGAPATKVMAMKVFNQLIKNMGGVDSAIKFLQEPVTLKELNKLNGQVGYKSKTVTSPNEIKAVVKQATGQDEMIPRAFIFGKKVGAYVLNNLGDHRYNTMDVWDSRFARSYIAGMFKENYGIANGIDEHEIIGEFNRAFNEQFRKTLNPNANTSAIQAVRWFYIKDAAKKAGYGRVFGNETISHYTQRFFDENK